MSVIDESALEDFESQEPRTKAQRRDDVVFCSIMVFLVLAVLASTIGLCIEGFGTTEKIGSPWYLLPLISVIATGVIAGLLVFIVVLLCKAIAHYRDVDETHIESPEDLS